jgi:hypothetical protein
LSTTACAPPLFGDDGGDDAEACAFAWCVAKTTPLVARMTMTTKAMMMERFRNRAKPWLVTAPDRLF